MWFRNLQFYRFTEPFQIESGELQEKMQENVSVPCQNLDMQTTGWDKPLGREGQLLVHEAAGCIMVCARREERVLPAAVIKDILDEKVAEIESSEVRKVGRKERNQLKDEIVIDLLPRAFTRSSRTFAYIDTVKQWVVVDSVSAKKAEDLLSLMRKSLGSFRVKPFDVKQSPAMVMTDWVKTSAPADIELQDECELRDPGEEGGIVRCRRQELDSDEITVHLQAGKQVVKLAISFDERVACLLSDDMSIKRLKFLDVIQEEAADIETEDFAARFDADFTLMTRELRVLTDRILELFGGLAE